MLKTAPPDHEWVTTQDGSQTLYSLNFKESCHCLAGAQEETLLHYIKGCQIVERTQRLPSLNILEVGFGTGLGMKLTYEATKDFSKPIHFLSLEIDKGLVDWFFSDSSEFQGKWMEQAGLIYFQGSRDHFHFTILIGNARLSLPGYVQQFGGGWNAIYQDAFSPKQNPILWSQEWFELLKASSAQDVILSTYSASNSVRKSLAAAGWKMSKGEKFGPKRTSTRAKLEGETDPEIALELSRSPIKPIRDENLSRELFQ